ncbi:MAG TPA: DUF4190 domain-containing protein [Actinomycetota bacterium]|nr:DUF4190 domain-containing protein [Actinomycetota bacterium]
MARKQEEIPEEASVALDPDDPRYHPGASLEHDAPRPGLSWSALGAVGCGIANFVILYPVGAILALILGYAAKRSILRSGGVQTGLKVAWLGILIGWVGLAVNIYTFIAYNIH